MPTLRSASVSCLCTLTGIPLLHPLQLLHIVAELIQALLPEAAIVADPARRAGERRRVEPHRTELRRASARDEARRLEHLQVLGDGRLAEVERRHELVHRRITQGEPR